MIFGKDMSTLRKLMLLKAATGVPLNEYEASGNPLTFETNKAKPLRSVLASWTPHQSGSGDPSPSNVRPVGGMDGVRVCQFPQNLLSINRSGSQETQGITYTIIKDGNNKAVAVHVEGTRTNTNPFFNLNYVNGTTISVPVGEYKMYGGVPGCRIQLFYRDENGVERIGGQDYGDGTTATVPEGATASWMRLLVDTNNPVNFVVYPVLIGISDAYAEFSVEFPALGKNLLDPSTLEQGGINSDGTETYNPKRIRTGYIPVKENTNYVLSAGSGYKLFMHFYDSEKRSIGVNTMSNVESPSGACYVRGIIGYQDDADIVPSDLTTGQIEENTSATSYEPFTNTIYGGTLDLVSGVLTAEWEYHVFNGSEKFIQNGTFTGGVRFLSNHMASLAYNEGGNAYCDKLAFVQSSVSTITKLTLKVGSPPYQIEMYIPTDSIVEGDPNVDDFKTWLASNNIAVCAELATPVVLATLSPTQITALIGNNTMWADADGLSVTYLKKG